MRSKAAIKGHSIHPILVSFPIAFFMGTFITDVIFMITENPVAFQFGCYLEGAGIFSALLAAIPGIIDYYGTVPPESSAKERATKHGLLNISMLLLFTTAIFLRQNSGINFLIILGLETVAIILLIIAGWHGGTLVTRNQIGVDHRYAGAGKWIEESTGEEDAIELHGLHKLKADQMKLLHVGKKRIVIAHTEKGYMAFDDRCTHRGGSLADGVMICGTVQCPWHGSQFDVKDGSVNAGPATRKIKTYEVELKNQKYYLILKKQQKDA